VAGQQLKVGPYSKYDKTDCNEPDVAELDCKAAEERKNARGSPKLSFMPRSQSTAKIRMDHRTEVTVFTVECSG
jgi:hypothetical protein